MKRFITAFALCLLLSCTDNAVEAVVPPVEKPSPIVPHPEKSDDSDSVSRWAALADSCTNVLVINFLEKTTGTFWTTPNDIERASEFNYWTQAHSLDVLLYCVQRLEGASDSRREEYLGYARKWYASYARNYNKSHLSDGVHGGFFNSFTDDMAWICLTLLRMADVMGEEEYASTAAAIFDNYIWPRRVRISEGVYALPWTDQDKDKTNFNACTNVPSCLVAIRLYQRTKKADYLDIAQRLYKFNISNMPDNERVEEPPLTYTQGVFGEVNRLLFHLTGEKQYADKAAQVLLYTVNSNRCIDRATGILRSEGTSMDQSIFKAIFVPYAVNFVLDKDMDAAKAAQLKAKLLLCAEALSANLDRSRYPRMFCNYFWGSPFDSGTASQGAQTSGASLMEGVARLEQED